MRAEALRPLMMWNVFPTNFPTPSPLWSDPARIPPLVAPAILLQVRIPRTNSTSAGDSVEDAVMSEVVTSRRWAESRESCHGG
jgi:hypothetical protein